MKALKRGDRYKLFKFDIYLNYKNTEQVQMVYTLLDEIPELEISYIDIVNGQNEFINTLLEKSMVKTKQELFKILQFRNPFNYQFDEPYEYLSFIPNPQKYFMNWNVKQAGCIEINQLRKDMNID